ncbi:hypothetical protein CTEN210_11611 [Chaetoceros tenuissimus]|uniref:Sulfotransferase domain-containing protein n=1 Tax=Chaetoceros tenuissimus TaxID=426638 RepID=A0AAD3D258_9STRA|nr:hypothetical protein CTEN210_11611 [Chaetoceros tenuissimus]
MASTSDTVRRRKTTSKKKDTKISQVATSEKRKKDTNDASNSSQASLWATIKKSPMFWISAVVMIPYSLYNFYLYLFLQRPDALQLATLNMYQPRPRVNLTDTRQVLIVGTISSGTTQVSHDLSKKLHLEIGHENAETNWSFVRDGTVSWFHGVRYIPRPGIDTELKNEYLFQQSINALCKQVYPNMGFHPFMFRDGQCNLRQSWDACWKDECKQVLTSEWGCGLKENEHTCVTPFQNVLHQVRHPLRTIESLVTKFCINGVEGKVQPVFITFASALFPQHDFSSMSCIEAAGYYVDEYNNAMLAVDLDHSFHVEETTICDIAKLAGFIENDVVYGPNKEIVSRICRDEYSDTNQIMRSNRNTYNSGKLNLSWDDLLGGKFGSRKNPGDSDLLNRIKLLSSKLGYS